MKTTPEQRAKLRAIFDDVPVGWEPGDFLSLPDLETLAGAVPALLADAEELVEECDQLRAALAELVSCSSQGADTPTEAWIDCWDAAWDRARRLVEGEP